MVQGIASNYYLDGGGENAFHPGPIWQPWMMWKNIYAHSVDEGLPEQCKDNLIGGFISLWTESIDDTTAMTRIFPRAFALGERLWSNPMPTGTDKDISIWVTALKRLRVVNDNAKA